MAFDMKQYTQNLLGNDSRASELSPLFHVLASPVILPYKRGEF